MKIMHLLGKENSNATGNKRNRLLVKKIIKGGEINKRGLTKLDRKTFAN